MSIIVREPKGGSGASILEAGTYLARCVGVVDLGVQYNEYNKKAQEKVLLIFELPSERVMIDGNDRPRWISKRYTASLHRESTLYKDLCAWRGKPFTPEELQGFNLANILTCPCVLTIVNTERNGNQYADIAAISKPMKGMEIPELENETVLFDIGEADAIEVLERLPNWMQTVIKKSKTWREKEACAEEEEEELPF